MIIYKSPIVWVLCLSLLIFGCNRSSNSENSESQIDSVDTPIVDSVVAIPPQDTLAVCIQEFIQAYAQQNTKAVNKLIHPDLGLKIIYRPGVSDTYVKVDNFDFEKPIPSYYSYAKLKNPTSPLRYSRLPTFDCGTEKWNKYGVYCDTVNHPKQLSTIAAFEGEFDPEKYSPSLLKSLASEERDSYRVIVTAEHPLIFHVQKYKGDWYVTVLDRAYATCDA